MKKNPSIYTLFGIGGFLFILDRWLKYIALAAPDAKHYIVRPWLGWEFFGNPGIAFSLPMPQFLMIVGTPIVLMWLYYMVSKSDSAKGGGSSNRHIHYFGLMLIVFGALSNFIDRLLLGYTIDYIRILTSVINIADVMIIAGVIILLLFEKKKNIEPATHIESS